MELLLLSLAVGILLGWRRWLPERVLAWSSKAMTVGVTFLLVTMGIRIGSDRDTIAMLGSYGLQALVFAVAAVVGSVLVVAVLEHFLVRNQALPDNTGLEIQKSAHPYRLTLIILASFILGIMIGRLVFPLAWREYLPMLTNVALNLTLLAVGLDLGVNSKVFRQILRLGWRVFLAPLGVIIGSILSAILVGQLFGWTWREGAAVGAGFGWYSLSGILITELHSVALGTVALLTNVIREILAILLIPVLARRVGQLTLVAPGGATTMDSTLSLIAAAGPPGSALVALVNGVCLSALVPVLVTLLLS